MTGARSAALLTLVLAGPLAAQPAGEAVGGFLLPEDRDAKQRLAAVGDYLAKKDVPWDVVCATAQQLLDGKSDSFTVLPGGTRASVKARVGDLLGGLPRDGKQFYELTFGPPAVGLLRDATANGYDRAKLADLAQRYYHTRAGTQAAVLLAAVRLDAGETAEAAATFRRLLARPDADALAGPFLLARAAAAYKRTGDPKLSAEADALLDKLDRLVPRDGLPVGRKRYGADDLRHEVTREVARPGRAAEPTAGRYGNPSHTGRGAAGSPFPDPAWSVPLLYRGEESKPGADWVRDKLAEVYKGLDPGKGQLALPGFFPVTAPGLAVYRGYDAVYAVATRDGPGPDGLAYQAGQVVWLSPMKYGAQALYGGDERGDAKVMDEGWRSFWQRASAVLVENTQTGSLSHDGKRVYCVDDWTVPPPPPQFTQPGGFVPPAQPGPARSASDSSRLYAIDLATGRLVWALGGDGEPAADDAGDAERLTRGGLFLGPPLAADGKLFVLVERDGQVKLVCLDPERVAMTAGPEPHPVPEVLWVQGLGAPAVKLASDPQRRTHAVFPAFADGVLVCPTHAGAVVAVDVTARTLLWARGYAATTDAGRQLGEGGGPVGMPARRGGFNPAFRADPGALGAVPADRWRAAAPVVCDGKVVLVAPDADQLVCLDLRTGEPAWAEPRRRDDLYLGAVMDGVVLVVGKAGVRAVRLHEAAGGKPVEAWPAVPGGSPCGHGAAGADGLYYLPLAGGGGGPADSPEPQVWAIHAATGAVKTKTTFRRPDPTADARRALGNLVFHDGLLLAQSVDAVTAYPLLGLKQQEMARRLTADAADPRGLLLRGELALDAGELQAALGDFRAAADRDPPADVRRAVRQKLYVAYTELLRADFAAAEKYLPEYEKLLDATADSEEPAEQQRASDETTRRRGLFLSLVARGREKQGRVREAVDAYLRYAALGDGRAQPVAGEAVSAVRPDVWAEGRLADLLAAAAAADRRAVAAAAEAEWQALQAADDLPRLRRFVAGYGPHEPAGKRAAVQLAGKLIAGTAPADRREGYAILSRLMADPDPAARALATERLAAALMAAGRPEHAVGLYARLGADYRDVPVRDGKTGGELAAGVLADRRLLPYLEPARPPLLGRYTVEGVGVGQGVAGPPVIGVRVEGPLLPSLRGVALGLHQGTNGDNRWVLSVSDRRTGEDLFRVPDLPQPAGLANGFGGPAAESTALASGHLVLVVVGTTAHCLDLLEKRELWRQPLLGRSPAHSQPTVTPQPDGDIEYAFDDGFKLRLGRSAVLRPAYAALVTRDGLVCVDPATRQTRWERADVSPRVQVWGDDRHLFLVETGETSGRTSRVLRASDGAAVAGVPDFAGLYAGAGRRAVLGRHLLVDSGSGTSPRTLRLYDPLTGKDVWSRPVPLAAAVLDAPTDPHLTGYVTADGRATVLDALTGKPLLDGADLPGADRVPAGSRPLLVADADRLFVFLSRRVGPQPGLMMANGFGPQAVRQTPVNGPAYCFDRRTGAALWHADRLFLGRTLVLERFDDLPCLVTVSDTPLERPGEKDRAALVRVEVVDKASGRVRFHQGVPNPGPFFAAVADPAAQAVEFVRPDVRVRLAPDGGK